jgi:hypothetical protein
MVAAVVALAPPAAAVVVVVDCWGLDQPRPTRLARLVAHPWPKLGHSPEAMAGMDHPRGQMATHQYMVAVVAVVVATPALVVMVELAYMLVAVVVVLGHLATVLAVLPC